MSKTKRYDKAEDRANDRKLHDNPNHPGITSHIKRLSTAEQEEKEGLQNYYESVRKD